MNAVEVRDILSKLIEVNGDLPMAAIIDAGGKQWVCPVGFVGRATFPEHQQVALCVVLNGPMQRTDVFQAMDENPKGGG